MKHILILSLFLIFSACYVNTKKIMEDFKPGSSSLLVNKQDSLLTVYKSGTDIPKEVVDELSDNTWVETANEIAPSNIVIRQYCLIDLINDKPDHHEIIVKHVNSLSYGGKIWAEGYSYWQYTEYFLHEWIVKFKDDVDVNELTTLTINIKKGFAKTAYQRDSIWYPAPFGDLRDVPLNDQLQEKCKPPIEYPIEHSIITIDTVNTWLKYTIKGKPVGLNGHVPKDTFYVEIINGQPNFKFYTGYSDKYKNATEEMLDLFDMSRIRSIKDN